MRMAVRDDQRQSRRAGSRQAGVKKTIDRGCHVDAAGAGVEQERSLVPDNQIQEWLFIVRARGLAKNEKMVIEWLNAKPGLVRTLRSARVPARCHPPTFEGTIGSDRARSKPAAHAGSASDERREQPPRW